MPPTLPDMMGYLSLMIRLNVYKTRCVRQDLFRENWVELLSSLSEVTR